ncbi:MAG: signal recognition particle-docking protein FtsY [Lentisphaeria bacterium]
MKSIFSKFKHGLQRTKTSLVRQIQGMVSDVENWDEETFEDLEAALMSADLGVEMSARLVDDIRDRYQRGEIKTGGDVLALAEKDVAQVLEKHRSTPVNWATEDPTVIFIVGVNGSGKTTTAAKLAYMWKQDGKSPLLAACDTFRAAGIDQVKIWGERIACPVVAGSHGGDASAAAFDAVKAAKNRGLDVVLIDTAGRQHTSRGLMAELDKMRRTVDKAHPGAPHEVWLTVDASTGTNAMRQAKEFGSACDLTGLILTKLDGSGKGGVVVPICRELEYPVRFVGLGEQMEDLQPFEADYFARALFE